MLEREIIDNDVKEEIRKRIEKNRVDFFNKLQNYNRENGGGREEKLHDARNLPVEDLVKRILKVQITNLHSERNFYFNIHNGEMKISEYIDRYFKK